MLTTGTPKRAWLSKVVIAVVVVVVIAVGGPFVYIHFIEGRAPAKFTLSASGAGSGGASVPLEGSWSLTSGSEAGYRVGEVLLGQKNTAVGRTTDVTGRIVIKGTTVDSGSFTANMKTVHSDQKQRDGQFQGKIMDTSTYPTATFTLTSPVQLGTPPASGATMAATAKGNLTLRGTTRPVVIQLTAEHVGTSLEVLGNLDVVFADWKIPQPSFPGVAVVQNHGTLEFLLQFIRGSVQPTTAQAPTTTALANGAYRACLAQHGVTIPAPGGPGGPPNPGAGGPSGAFGAGGPPGGPGGGQQSPQVQAARLACRSLAPAGGPGQIVVSPTTVAPLQLGAG